MSVEGVDYLPCYTIDAFREAFGIVSKDPPKTLVIDSLTHVSDMLMDEIKASMPEPLPGKTYDARIIVPRLYDKTLQTINALTSLPCDVVFIAKHETVQQNDVSFNRPRLQGTKLTAEIPYLLDIIIYMHKGDDEVVATPCATTFSEGKDRSGKLPIKIPVEKVSLARMINYIKGEKDAT